MELGCHTMKLIPPQADVKLYEQGFGDSDILKRMDAGKQLSDILEAVEDPIVVALDGAWGSGKSYFLRRWIGAHQLENAGSGMTVYFDAFAHDYLEDPLIALTAAIGERLPKGSKRRSWEKAKKLAFWVARPALRLTLAAATVGVTEIAGPVGDALAEAGSKDFEKAAEEFWRREDGRKAAMQQFQDCLARLTAPSGEGLDDGKPLIVVIDELDRCRPDYALNVLEVIKHFFAVPRVHFVLGTNLEALGHIVQARYGSGVDADDYLKRFISLSMRLPEEIHELGGARSEAVYFKAAAQEMGIQAGIADPMLEHLKLSGKAAAVSLRDVERLLTRLALLPRKREIIEMNDGWQSILMSMVLMQVLRPKFFSAVVSKTILLSDIKAFYGMTPTLLAESSDRSGEYNHRAYLIHAYWTFALSDGEHPKDENHSISKQFDRFGLRRPSSIISSLYRDFFSIFDPKN